MKQAKETKNVKKTNKLTRKHQIIAYGGTILVLTIYLYIMSVFYTTASIWSFIGAILVAMVTLPVLQGLVYPK